MNKILDKILLSDNPVESFNTFYNNNLEFKNWLINLLPEVEDCKNLKQDNPWHIYNCLEHILNSVKEINKLTTKFDYKARKMLAYTMFLHDIGKPECKIRRYSKLYKKEIDSFFNHNKASKKIANRVLKDFGFNEKESEIIETLIDEHDMFMFITLTDDKNPHHQTLTNNLLKQEINKLNKVYNGYKMMDYLLCVGRADNLSQNPAMTKNSLLLLDKMQNMLNNLNKKTNEEIL